MNLPARACTKCERVLPNEVSDTLCPYCLLALADDEAADTCALPSPSQFTAPTVAELQEHFDVRQIEIIELHGRGGMGAVYRAHQPKLDRDVALKILPPELALASGFDERFQREAQVLAKLNHANIVDVYDFGKAGPFSYLLLEFVDGVNLRELIIGGETGPADALEIVPQLCDALQFAHDMGVVHRDVKPENILIDTSGRVKITDFGLAKLARSTSQRGLTQTNQAMGTPHYMAPEQIERPKDVDHRADIYAMGVVFYELLTGELPLGRFDPPGFKSGTSRRLDRVVLKTLDKDPNKRFEQASEVKSEVEKEPKAQDQNDVANESQWIDRTKEQIAAATRKGQEFIDSQPKIPLLAIVVSCLSVFTYLFVTIGLLSLCSGNWDSGVLIVITAISLGMGIAAPSLFRWKESEMGPITKRLTSPLLRVTDWIKHVVAHHPLFLLTIALFAIGVVTVVISVASKNAEPLVVGVLFLIVSFCCARWAISGRPSKGLATKEKWGFYPPILTLLLPVVGLILFGVPIAASVVAFRLTTVSPPLLIESTIITFLSCFATICSGWFAVLALLWGYYPTHARALLRPIVNEYNGRGMYILCILSATVCVASLLLQL